MIFKNSIFHKSNNFFSIGFVFEKKIKKFSATNYSKRRRYFRIIKQKKQGKDFYLLQSKIEPGNINGVQLSPTVQATKSNYLRKHGGKNTVLDYLLKKTKI